MWGCDELEEITIQDFGNVTPPVLSIESTDVTFVTEGGNTIPIALFTWGLATFDGVSTNPINTLEIARANDPNFGTTHRQSASTSLEVMMNRGRFNTAINTLGLQAGQTHQLIARVVSIVNIPNRPEGENQLRAVSEPIEFNFTIPQE